MIGPYGEKIHRLREVEREGNRDLPSRSLRSSHRRADQGRSGAAQLRVGASPVLLHLKQQDVIREIEPGVFELTDPDQPIPHGDDDWTVFGEVTRIRKDRDAGSEPAPP